MRASAAGPDENVTFVEAAKSRSRGGTSGVSRPVPTLSQHLGPSPSRCVPRSTRVGLEDYLARTERDVVAQRLAMSASLTLEPM